jgi:transposase, IS30 family
MPSGYPFSRAVRREFLDLVCEGMPVIQAERAVGVSLNTGSRWWREAGAMKLRVSRWGDGGLANPGNVFGQGGKGHRLSLDERIAIMRGLDAKLSYAQIGRRIGRDRSVVWREHQRNCNPDGDYHARMAHARAGQKACRPKQFKLLDNPLCAVIEAWMDQGWSPKLIAEVLARDHPDDRLLRVSHETIYQCLYVQTRGSLRADLHKCLSTKRVIRKAQTRYISRGSTRGRNSPSATGPPKQRTGPCPAAGKVI